VIKNHKVDDRPATHSNLLSLPHDIGAAGVGAMVSC
jgi:hypothetical protein